MRLRPPVKDEELEIDHNNGMKKYIATEGRGFDTSTYCIRMHLRKCIELGRSEWRALSVEKSNVVDYISARLLFLLSIDGGEKERYEAYRELGTALHTLEDFLAHCKHITRTYTRHARG